MVDLKINLFKNDYKKDEKHPSYTNKKVTIEEDIPAGIYDGALWGGKTKDGTPMVSIKIATPQEKPSGLRTAYDPDKDDIPF